MQRVGTLRAQLNYQAEADYMVGSRSISIFIEKVTATTGT
jgi:hypothetical protein